VSLSIGVQSFAQQRTSLKVRIDELANRILDSIDKDDLFIKSDKGYISDADHQVIKKIIMTNGFPTISMVGKESSHKFWMLVQLCDHDPRMQMAVAKHMSYMIRSGDVVKEDFAMMSDRARMNKSLPQLYGTQFVISDEGAILLYQTHDLDHINARRKAIGLTPFEDYKNRVAPSLASKEQAVETSDYSDYPNSN
jgi:hypothetical protein